LRLISSVFITVIDRLEALYNRSLLDVNVGRCLDIQLFFVVHNDCIPPVFAPRTCGSCIAQFEKLTESFMSDVLRLIPPDPISPFVKLTTQFGKDVIKAVYAGHARSPDDPIIPNLVRKYDNEMFHTSLPQDISNIANLRT
jgi:hypothetical protein